MVVFKVRGLVPPVFTPLKGQSLNIEVVPAYAEYLAKSGIKSVLVGGTNGQNMALRVSDRKKLINSWVEVNKRTGMHTMVQIGGAAFPDVIDLAKHCASAGVNSLLTLPELYFRPQSVSELVSYVARVAAAAPDLPILYYHIPHMSKVEINMPAFVTAASKQIPNFKGIKFSSTDLTEAVQVLNNLNADQEIFLGSDKLLAAAALLGIRSSIGVSDNLFPKLAQDRTASIEKDDISTARALQNKLSSPLDAITGEGVRVPSLKASMKIISGLDVGPPCLPQEPISDASLKNIEKKLEKLGLI